MTVWYSRRRCWLRMRSVTCKLEWNRFLSCIVAVGNCVIWWWLLTVVRAMGLFAGSGGKDSGVVAGLLWTRSSAMDSLLGGFAFPAWYLLNFVLLVPQFYRNITRSDWTAAVTDFPRFFRLPSFFLSLYRLYRCIRKGLCSLEVA